ncbi:MAG: NlpC/P60 family protein [Alphaproteobacteria bacterium]
MTSPILDPRLYAYRPDLADKALSGQVKAPRYADGAMARVAAGRLAMFAAPDLSGPMVSELRLGEFVDVFERKDGVAWVQNRSDRYVGYVAEAGLADTVIDPAWRIANLWTYLYPEPTVKSVPIDILPFPGHVAVAGETGDGWTRLTTGGFIVSSHLEPATAFHADYAFTAGRLLHAPYLWGGRTALGVDCSGLVQMALELADIDCPRDSDMQQAAFGAAPPSDWRDYPFARGDLVFFAKPLHVGIMADASHLIHADGDIHMRVIAQPLADAVARRGAITAIGAGESLSLRPPIMQP